MHNFDLLVLAVVAAAIVLFVWYKLRRRDA